MNHRVRIATAALFALCLVLQTQSLSAATRDRESFAPGFVERVVRNIKKVLKPLAPTTLQDSMPVPLPPRP